jgi:D-arabinose 1-dehydrogenase-like Zn-dependent alcohol dehydrogenase
MTLVERPEPDAARLASLEGANYGDVVVEVHASGFTGNELEWPSTWIDRLGHDRTPSIPGHEVAGDSHGSQLWSNGAVGGTAGVRPYGSVSRRHTGGVCRRRGAQPAPLPGDVDFTVGASVAMTG